MEDNKRFSFWITWLKTVSIVFAAFGIVLAFLNRTLIFTVCFHNNINPVFFGETPLQEPALAFQQWVYALMGSACVLIGILIFFIAKYALAKKEKWARNGILIGLVAWFVMDTPASLYFRVYFNVAFNMIFLIAMILPLLLTGKYFKSQPGGKS